MNKNYNYDDTIIESGNGNTGDTTRIDPGTPPPFEGGFEGETGDTPPPFDNVDYDNDSERKESSSSKGIIAATAGIALAGGAAAAYGLGAFDAEENPDVIADSIASGDVALSENVATPNVTVDVTIGSDENVKSLGINITVPESLDEIRLTTVATDDMSFSEAFAAARRAVGPHGVFEWRGGVYGTYYDNEWRHMPADYKRQFSNHDWRSEMADMGPGETIIPGGAEDGGALEVGSYAANGDVIIQENHYSSHTHNHYAQNNYQENNVIIIDGGDSNGNSGNTGNNHHATTQPTEEPSIFDFTIDDVMISLAPTDDMDYLTAFNVARADVGPGGVYEWRGNVYHTFYPQEWESLSTYSQNTFVNYNWGEEIAKAKSQPEYLYGAEELYADIPVDPTTGEPINELGEENLAENLSDDLIYDPETGQYININTGEYVPVADNGSTNPHATDPNIGLDSVAQTNGIDPNAGGNYNSAVAYDGETGNRYSTDSNPGGDSVAQNYSNEGQTATPSENYTTVAYNETASPYETGDAGDDSMTQAQAYEPVAEEPYTAVAYDDVEILNGDSAYDGAAVIYDEGYSISEVTAYEPEPAQDVAPAPEVHHCEPETFSEPEAPIADDYSDDINYI